MFSLDTSDLALLADDFKEIAEEEVKNTVLAVQFDVTRATPVKTGLARSNWQVGKNTPVVASQNLNSQRANRLAAQSINYTIGDTYYITNTTDYLYYVNFGSSRQAGQFFVENAITNAIRRLER